MGAEKTDITGADKARVALSWALAESGEVRGPCPGAEDIALFHEGALSDDHARRHVAAHVARCEQCRGAWMDLVAFSELEVAASAKADRSDERSPRSLLDRLPVPRPGVWVPTALAASAVIAVTLLVRPMIGVSDLPAYALRMEGMVAAERSEVDPLAPAVFVGGNTFSLTLRPEQPSTRPPGADALRLQLYTIAGPTITAVNTPSPGVSPAGVVSLRGEIGRDIVLPSGESVLLILLGRAGALPDEDELLARVLAEQALVGDGWRGWLQAITVR